MAEPPMTITYDIFVVRNIVCIDITLSKLGNLEVKIAEIMNAYITETINENIQTVLRSESCDNAGKVVLIFISLYLLKSVGSDFSKNIVGCMKQSITHSLYLTLTCG